MRRNKWIYLMLLAVASVATLATGSVAAALLLLFLLVAAGLSLLCRRLTDNCATLSLEIADVSIAGRPIPVNLLLQTKGRLPLGRLTVAVEYYNLVFGTTEEQDIVLEPGASGRLEYVLPYTGENCGKTVITVRSARLYDCLGLVSSALPPPPPQEIIINPALRRLEIKLRTAPSTRSSGTEYDHLKKGQDSSEAFDLRDYHPGDNIHSIHWKLSGKFDELLVREYSTPINYRTALYYNMDVGDKLPTDEARDLQNAILQMTASVSHALLENGYAHHLLSVDGGSEQEILVRDNSSYYTMLSEMMCRRIPARGEDADLALQFIARESRFSKMIIVCGRPNIPYLRSLTATTAVTVLYLQHGGEQEIEMESGLLISRIRVDYFRDKMQQLEL